MSRSLPPHPNLTHLKKQAKDLLREMQQQDPATQLADAQHALARNYGFASWPKLKAHVESLPAAEKTAGPASPFTGRWVANLAKSRPHPANPFQSAILEFSVLGDSVTIVSMYMDDAGRELRDKNTVQADGVERQADHGYSLMASWRGPRTLETLAKKDGQPAGWGRYEVSEDGQTLTISADEQLVVLERR